MHTAAHSLVTAVLTLTACAAVGLFVPQALKVFDPGIWAAGFMARSGAGKWAAVVGTNVGIWWAGYAAVLSIAKWASSPVAPAESNSAHDHRGGSAAEPGDEAYGG